MSCAKDRGHRRRGLRQVDTGPPPCLGWGLTPLSSAWMLALLGWGRGGGLLIFQCLSPNMPREMDAGDLSCAGGVCPRWRQAKEAPRRGLLTSFCYPLGDSGCTWLPSRPDVRKCQLVSLIRRQQPESKTLF